MRTQDHRGKASSTETRLVQRRPRDRRDTVAREAGELFAVRGFSRVRMEDIAAAVGVTPRALYRHFPSKTALLTHLITEAQAGYAEAITADRSSLDPPQQLDDVLSRLAEILLDNPTPVQIWRRESRHLDPVEQAAVLARGVEGAGRLGLIIASARNEPPARHHAVLAWASLFALAGVPRHWQQVPRPIAYEALLRAGQAIVTCPIPTGDAAGPMPPSSPRDGSTLTSRREQLLNAAARLFAVSGYDAVTLEEIGACVGIEGPSVYHHFANKASILSTLVNRYNEWLTLALVESQSQGDAAMDALDRFGRRYVELAVSFPDLVSVAIDELICLPAEEVESLRRIRTDIDNEWAALLRRARPDLSVPASLVLVHTASAAVDEIVRAGHLRSELLSAQATTLLHCIHHA